MLLQFVPALADGTATMTSTFDGAAGVPVDAKIPLTFSEDVTLSDIDITVSPSTDIKLSGSGTSYFVEFTSAMNYETEYTVKVGTYGAVKYTTQFDTTSAKNYTFGEYTKDEYSAMPVNMKEFTVEVDIDTLYSDVASAQPDFDTGSAGLEISDSQRDLGIHVGFEYSKNRSGTIDFSYHKPGNSSVQINHLFKPNSLNQDQALSLTEARKYALTLKDNTLYVFNIGDENKTLLGYIELDFYQANFKNLGFTADQWKVTNTSYVAVKFAGTGLISATSTFNNMKGVPVNTQIPLTYTKNVNLTKDDVTVSPEADFTLEGSGKNYVVKFTEDMDYETDYTVSVKDIEIVKYRTEYDYSASTTVIGNDIKVTLNNTSKNFSVEMDLGDWTTRADATSAKLNLSGTDENYYYGLSVKDKDSEASTFKATPEIKHPDIPASQYASAGSITSDSPATVSMSYKKLIVTVEDYTIYLYGVGDSSVDFVKSWNMLTYRSGWTPTTADIVPTTIWMSNTSLISAKFGTTVPVTFTSSLNGKVAVPVTAYIPLTCSKNVVLSSDSVTVSPAEDFTVEGSGKNYAVKFTNGMKSNTEYTVSVDGVEVAKYSTAYDPSTKLTYAYNGTVALPKASTNFTTTLDFSDVISNKGTYSTIGFKDTTRNLEVRFRFDITYTDVDNNKVPNKFTMQIEGLKDETSKAGPKVLIDADTATIGKITITHKNNQLYIYTANTKNVNLTLNDEQSTNFNALKMGELGYTPDTLTTNNTTKIGVYYGAPDSVEITSCTPSDGVVNATAAVNTTLDDDAVLIFAAYSDNGMTLVDANVKKASDVANGAVSFKVLGTPATYKLFVFDSIDSLIPIVNAVSGNLK